MDARVERGTRAMLALREERLAAGERPIGWKLGLGAPAVQERLGLDGPLVGFLTDAGLLASGATAAIGGWTGPTLEAELAVHIGRDVPAGTPAGEVPALVAGIGPAIELVDIDLPLEDVEGILAGDIFHRHVLLGDPMADWPAPEGLPLWVRKGSTVAAETSEPLALTGDVFELVAHTAAVLETCGAALRAGDVLICGAAVPALPVSPGDHVTVDWGPLGAVDVQLTG